ncbi:MAG: arginine--tRNA ligase [Chloroflexota bacterium]|nr:arginine--tRNA ligase [Chloroflexota bacterium]MDE2942041.1 arginine--tRNA ligase [Chloroflexota bacterium]MDE3267265.1 arginine--tRNA ligase [Chloroflexota bacterium]
MHLIRELLANALAEAQASGQLPSAPPIEVPVEHPQSAEHGDYASSLPLRLARALRMNPLEIANRLVPLIPAGDALARVWPESPGFINFALEPRWLAAQVEAVIEEGPAFGNVPLGGGESVQVEFVSINPTGPIHVGHARGGVLGDVLARVLDAAGFSVTREYYFNDAGNQMDNFYGSLHARYLQAMGQDAELPQGGYVGEYMVDVAKEIADEEGDRLLDLPAEQAVEELGRIGLGKMMRGIQSDMERLRIDFDVWFREHTLYSDGQYEKAMDALGSNNHLAKREGATWFVSTALGEDKDNVLVRGTGVPTYFAADVAYHYNKFVERGFSRVIDVWGADHQGHVSRMKAAIGALGIDPDRLTILINQMVTLKRGQQILRASKRAGEFITLQELLDEVGTDPCRYFFLARSPDSQMEFDLELAKKSSNENPVFYIQYAHARVASILKLAAENGIDHGDGDVSLLTDPAELALIRKILELPELIESMAVKLEPHHLPHYSQDLATAFHWFYQQCRVVSTAPGDEAITRARLKLVQASAIALGRALSLMGMEAPEKM